MASVTPNGSHEVHTARRQSRAKWRLPTTVSSVGRICFAEDEALDRPRMHHSATTTFITHPVPISVDKLKARRQFCSRSGEDEDTSQWVERERSQRYDIGARSHVGLSCVAFQSARE